MAFVFCVTLCLIGFSTNKDNFSSHNSKEISTNLHCTVDHFLMVFSIKYQNKGSVKKLQKQRVKCLWQSGKCPSFIYFLCPWGVGGWSKWSTNLSKNTYTKWTLYEAWTIAYKWGCIIIECTSNLSQFWNSWPGNNEPEWGILKQKIYLSFQAIQSIKGKYDHFWFYITVILLSTFL